MTRVVVSFTLDIDEAGAWCETVDSVCAMLPPRCEDIVIQTEEERDRLRALAEEDQEWMASEEPLIGSRLKWARRHRSRFLFDVPSLSDDADRSD